MKFFFIFTPLFILMINFTLGNEEQQTVEAHHASSKEILAREISLKIQTISKRALEFAKTPVARYKVLHFLKQKLYKSAKQRNKDIDDNRLRLYVNLILKGVEMNMRKLLASNSNRGLMNGTETRRTEEDSQESNKALSDNLTSQYQNKSQCSMAVKKICSDLTNVYKLTCKIDDTFIMVEKLCDGIMDCPDASDEYNCTSQALSMILKINVILRQVDTYISQDCLKGNIELPVITSQNIALHDILNSQIQLIQSFDSIDLNDRRNGKISLTLTQHMNDVANVVLTIARAMESSICTPNAVKCQPAKLQEVQESIRKKLAKFPSRSAAKECQCNNEFCKNEKCPTVCKNICQNRYLLERFSCKSINGETSISLDLICDGKLDCLDETDEDGCDPSSVLSKFERNSLYETLLDFIRSKNSFSDYVHVNIKIESLYKTVRKLSTLSLKSKLDLVSIKKTRDEAFSLLKSIYNDLIKDKPNVAEHVGINNFLSEIKNKLITALMKSSSGNIKVVTPNECLCAEDICIIPKCSKRCQRACSVEVRLTRYNCLGVDNMTVGIEYLCNGEPECPNGDDEIGCKTDICRHHHLVVLSHTVKSVGEKSNIKGTALGEVLNAWKIKTLGTIKIASAQTDIRPTRITIRRIMTNILDDLVMTYASLETFRRTANNYEHVIKEFENVANNIISTYKLCLK